jgi:hypothetical protein
LFDSRERPPIDKKIRNRKADHIGGAAVRLFQSCTSLQGTPDALSSRPRRGSLFDHDSQRGAARPTPAGLSAGASAFLPYGVTASAGPSNSTALLGQSFLSRFKSWTLDNQRHVIVLTELQ